MRCPACNVQNPEGGYLCAHCGKQMRSAFGRGEGPVKLGQAPELSAPLATVAREETKPANLSSARPADYAPPELGGTGWQAPPAPAAYVSTLLAAAPATDAPPEQPRPPAPPAPPEVLDNPDDGSDLSATEPEAGGTEGAAASTDAEAEDELPVLFQRLPPGTSPFRQGIWTRPAAGPRPAAPTPASPSEEAVRPGAGGNGGKSLWNMDIGELIGSARDRAERLRVQLTPDALQQYDEGLGNTSGLGRGYPLPQSARKFSLGGLAPLGLFGFAYKHPLLGLIGLGLFLLKWYPLYVIYIAVVGRQLAWQNQRYESVAAYEKVMQRWDLFGFFMLPLYLVWYVIALLARSM